jgi:hypothetical protein
MSLSSNFDFYSASCYFSPDAISPFRNIPFHQSPSYCVLLFLPGSFMMIIGSQRSNTFCGCFKASDQPQPCFLKSIFLKTGSPSFRHLPVESDSQQVDSLPKHLSVL